MVELVWLIPALPLIGFLILLLVGSRIGEPRAGWVATTAAAGSFLAAGSGSGIAGFGAHLAIIDDPISEQDAFSKARREALNEWYASGLRTFVAYCMLKAWVQLWISPTKTSCR